MRFEVHAGKTARPAGPVTVVLSAEQAAQLEAPGLIDTKTGKPVALQRLPEGGLCWPVPAMKADERRVYAISADGLGGADSRVVVDQDHPEQVDVRIGNKALTSYNFAVDDAHPRPNLYPLIGPTQVSVTRHYPMKPGVPHEKPDHPHHQSCWVAWGKINGVDHWSTSDKCGFQRQRGLTTTISGPVFGQIEAVIDWVTRQDKRQLTEYRTYRFWHGDDATRMFDQTVTFCMTDGDVTFGDTKEGGICATRVAGTMKEKSGGTITNAEGKVGAKACWGQPSPWVDYSGPVGDHTVGLAIFDHPKNFRHPTRWHVRDYGLFTVNCFGWSHFKGKGNDGSHTWKAGERVTFRHRVFIHTGDVKQGQVAGHYQNYADPPSVRVLTA